MILGSGEKPSWSRLEQLLPAKIEDADKEDGRREAMEKPAKAMSVTWVLRGAAKTISRMTPARSSWRTWDPGRREAHAVLRG